MKKALVIKQDGYILPRGHISALVDNPSDYEKSPQSPWEIVEVADDPRAPMDLVKDTLGRDRYTQSSKRHLLINKGIKKEDRKDFKKPKKPKIHQYPPHLKRSSIVWDYGMGHTYSSPQAAIDAMVLYWGGGLIDQINYVRGWDGIYIEPLVREVAHLYDLSTEGGESSWIILDTEPGQSVEFRGMYPIMGPNGSGSENVVDHVKIRGLKLTSSSAALGVACQDPWPGPVLNPREWHIEDCLVQHDATPYGNSIGILLLNCQRGFITRTKVTGFASGAPTGPGITLGAMNPSFFVLKSSIIDARDDALYFNLDPAALVGGMFLTTSLLKGKNCIRLYDGVLLASWMNNIMVAEDYIIDNYGGLENITQYDTDGNLYQFGTEFTRTKGGDYPLKSYQDLFRTDQHSIVGDAKLDADLVPEDDSPAWRNGIVWGYQDIEGRLIARTIIDIGPYQRTYASPYDPGTCGYCSIQDVKDATGIEYGDLELGNENDLDGLLCRWIGDVSGIIDRFCETSWDLGTQPGAVKRVAITMMADLVSLAVQRRKSPFITLNTFTVKMVQDDLLTDDNKEVLLQYKKPNATLGKQFLGMGSGPVDSEDEEL